MGECAMFRRTALSQQQAARPCQHPSRPRQPDTLLFAARPRPSAIDRETIRESTRESLRAAWRDPEARKARMEKRRAAMTEREPVAESTRAKLRAAWRDPESRKARIEKRRATLIELGIIIGWEANMDLALCIRLAAGHSRQSIARHIGVAEMTVVNRGRALGIIGEART